MFDIVGVVGPQPQSDIILPSSPWQGSLSTLACVLSPLLSVAQWDFWQTKKLSQVSPHSQTEEPGLEETLHS